MTESVPEPRKVVIAARPFEIVMTQISVERDLTPVMQVGLVFTMNTSNQTFTYETEDAWLDFESLDTFITDLGILARKEDGKAELATIDRGWKIELARVRQAFIITLAATIQQAEIHTDLISSFTLHDLHILKTWYHHLSEFRR